MKTCKNCKFLDLKDKLPYGWGTCGLTAFENEDPSNCRSNYVFVNAYCEDGHYAVTGDLTVSPNYGCVNFEKRQCK